MKRICPARAVSITAIAAIATSVLVGCRSKPPKAPAPSIESHFPLASSSDAELCRALGRAPAVSAGDAGGRRKVIISDLHIGPGSSQGARFDGLDDFFADAVLSRLLARLKAQPTELIIAGDFIEFWQIEGALDLLPPREEKSDTVLGADQAGSLAALDVAMTAHPTVFAELAAFLASGDHRLVFIAGNHDSDLIWPRVQLAIARALGVRDLSKLSFASSAYVAGGVHIEHGHRLDAANTSPTTLAGAGPVALDASGRCRLQSSWGQVFVARFFNQLEQKFPFVDNLYPESAALMWGMRAEPDVTESALASYRFAEMLLSAQSGRFNLSALRSALLNLAGVHDKQASAGDLAGVWDRLPISETFWAAVSLLVTDPEFRPLRDALVRAARALPDIDAVGAELASIDMDIVSKLKDRVSSDPLTVAATEILREKPALRVVVFAHTHVPGGEVRKAGRGHYANTGTWAPIAKISELKRRKIPWTQLSVENTSQFPRRFPAVVIDYHQGQPQPPHIVYAQ